MGIYTRTGDLGKTGLLDGSRIGKDDLRLEAYGTIDELNTVLGVVRSEGLPEPLNDLLERLQHELFELGAELATVDPTARGTGTIGPDHVSRLEAEIDRYEEPLPRLKQFILPAGTRAAAGLHLARSVCRRAERRLVALVRQNQHQISPSLLAYLNRLGDLLFVLARSVNAQAGLADVTWEGGRKAEGGRRKGEGARQ